MISKGYELFLEFFSLEVSYLSSANLKSFCITKILQQ